MAMPANIKKLIREENERSKAQAYVQRIEKVAHMSKWSENDSKQFRSVSPGPERLGRRE